MTWGGIHPFEYSDMGICTYAYMDMQTVEGTMSTSRKQRHVTSQKMRDALERLRSGARESTYGPTEDFEQYAISGRDVRGLEETEGRTLDACPGLSASARKRWRGRGARGLEALEAVFYITGGYEADGVWVA